MLLLAGAACAYIPSHRRSSCRPRAAASHVIASLPPTFLLADEFDRARSTHASILQLRRDAPRAFSAPPSGEYLADTILLRGDFKQELARGREAYQRVFSAIARVNTSPLVPLAAGQVVATFEPARDSLRVCWRTSVRPSSPMLSRLGDVAAASEFELTGVSTYTLDEKGVFSEHVISDLRVNGRRLPSSEFGEWLDLLERRAPSTPAAALALIGATLRGPAGPPPPPPVSPSSPYPTAVPRWGGRADGVPLPGTMEWVRYAALHAQALELAAQFRSLLSRPADLSAYADDIELRA